LLAGLVEDCPYSKSIILIDPPIEAHQGLVVGGNNILHGWPLDQWSVLNGHFNASTTRASGEPEKRNTNHRGPQLAPHTPSPQKYFLKPNGRGDQLDEAIPPNCPGVPIRMPPS